MSLLTVPIESSYATSYYWLILTSYLVPFRSYRILLFQLWIEIGHCVFWAPPPLAGWGRAELTIRGAHTNVRRGPYSYTCGLQDFFSEGASLDVHFFFPQKVDNLFSRHVQTFKSKHRGKNFAVDRGPPGGGGPPMVQPAQWLIRPWAKGQLTYCTLP